MTIRRIFVDQQKETNFKKAGKAYRLVLPKSLVEDLGMAEDPYLDQKGRPVVDISVQAANPPTLVLRSVKQNE